MSRGLEKPDQVLHPSNWLTNDGDAAKGNCLFAPSDSHKWEYPKGKVLNAAQDNLNIARGIFLLLSVTIIPVLEFVRLFSDPDDAVLDLYSGSMTFACAAILERRNAVAIDNDPQQRAGAQARVYNVAAKIKAEHQSILNKETDAKREYLAQHGMRNHRFLRPLNVRSPYSQWVLAQQRRRDAIIVEEDDTTDDESKGMDPIQREAKTKRKWESFFGDEDEFGDEDANIDNALIRIETISKHEEELQLTQTQSKVS